MNTQCWIGMPVEQIPTPALVVDVEKLDRNLETMANYLARVKTNIRPHAKTHKTPAIAHKQMRAGAVGLCCATVGEAEVMVYSGIPEVMIANEVVDPLSVRRAVNLARQARDGRLSWTAPAGSRAGMPRRSTSSAGAPIRSWERILPRPCCHPCSARLTVSGWRGPGAPAPRSSPTRPWRSPACAPTVASFPWSSPSLP